MRRLSLAAGILALTALACTDPTSLLPTTPSAPGVTSIEIGGPGSIAPGQSVQLVANVRLADGTVKQSSPGTPLNWFSSNSSVLRVTAAGLATGLQLGDARITVFQGTGSQQRFSTREFVVVPDGTYRLVGQITEADGPTVPVTGARVTVTPGSFSMFTGLDGRYQFYGVPADAVVTITKNGYSPVSQPIQLTTHSTRNFALVLIGTRLTVAGPYRLTLDVTGACSSAIPLNASLQQRTYDAILTQNGAEITVVLTEPRFRTNQLGRGNKFIGRASTSEISFFLDQFDLYYYYYDPIYYPSVAERLSDNTFLVPHGTVSTTISSIDLENGLNRFSGNMSGVFNRWDTRFPQFNTNVIGYCSSSAIRFTLTPR